MCLPDEVTRKHVAEQGTAKLRRENSQVLLLLAGAPTLMSKKGGNSPLMSGGLLTINCEGAKDVHSHGIIFRTKPYVSLRVGGHEVRTTAAKHGGSNPVWGQTLRINVNQEEELYLEVKCQHDGSTEVLGYAALPLARVREAGADRVTAPLQRHRRSTGEVVQQGSISLALTWAPAAAAAVAAYPAPAGGVVPGYPVAGYPQQPLQRQPQPQQPAANAPMPMLGPPPQQVQQVVYAQQSMPQPPRVVVAPPPPPPTVVYMPPPPPAMPPTTVIYESSHCHGHHHHRHHRHHHHHSHYGHHHHHHHHCRYSYDGGDLVLAGAVGFGLGLLL